MSERDPDEERAENEGMPPPRDAVNATGGGVPPARDDMPPTPGAMPSSGAATLRPEEGTSADRQLRTFERTGDLKAVVDQLIAETMEGITN